MDTNAMTDAERKFPRMLETINAISNLIGADLDKRTISVIIAMIDSGVSAESTAFETCPPGTSSWPLCTITPPIRG